MRGRGRIVGIVIVLALAAGGGYYAWRTYLAPGLPDGFARSNGRIEATEIDIATKIAGRADEILIDEGDFVEAGDILARMDTSVLQAQLHEAQAQLTRAETAIESAGSLVRQREAERAAAEAVVAQREAEAEAARRRLARTEELVDRGTAPVQQLDDDRAQSLAAQAAVSAAQAQVAAAEAAVNSATSMIADAEAAVEAAKATIERIQADIDDSVLRAPRNGRVQYLVAEEGEVLNAGGVVLNMVDLTDV